MKLVLVSKLNFRETRDSLVTLTCNAEYLIEELIHRLSPGTIIRRVGREDPLFDSSSAISIYDCDPPDSNEVHQSKQEYRINGDIGIMKIDLPSRDLSTSDVTMRMRNLIDENHITYIDVRVD